MRRYYYILLAVSLVLLPFFGVLAQGDTSVVNSPQGGTTIRTLTQGRADLDPAIVSAFLQNAPILFNTPGIPRFAIVGNDRQFYFGIGGTLRTTVSYDWKNPLSDAMYFRTSEIPMDNPRANNGATQLGMGGTSLFFNFVALPQSKFKVGAYVNFNFENSDFAPCLQYAYVNFYGFMTGYNYTNFCDEAAVPPSIDMEGPPTLPLIQNVSLRYTYQKKHWSAGIAVEVPSLDATFNEFTSSMDMKYPLIPGFVEYAWDEGENSVRLSGLFRRLNYLNNLTEEAAYCSGWGAQLSGKLTPSPFLTAYYQGVYGKGIGCVIQDICGKSLDFVPNEDRPGRLTPVPLWGGMIGLKCTLSEKIFMAATYSQMRCTMNPYEDGDVLWADQIRKLQYFNANIFYALSSNAQVALEYIHGRKQVQDRRSKSNNRVQVLLQFDF